jgi:hypothetical protein
LCSRGDLHVSHTATARRFLAEGEPVDAVGEQPEDQDAADDRLIARVGTLRNEATGSSVLVSWLAPDLVSTMFPRSPLRAPDPGAPKMLPGKECAVTVGAETSTPVRDACLAHARTAMRASGCPPDGGEPICSGLTALAAVLGPGRPRLLRYGCTRTSEFRTLRRVGAGALAASRAA